MMPHLGLLSTVHPKASWEIFDRDCLVRLGTVIAAKGVAKPGTPVMTVEITMPDGSVTEELVAFGEIKRLPLGVNESAQVRVIAERGFEVSNEGVREITGEASGGEVGLVLDGRGRPIVMESDPDARIQQIKSWFKSMGIYKELEESQ